MFDFIMPENVVWAFIVVSAAIVIDVVLGAIRAATSHHDAFDLRELPKFLGSGVLPYVGGLGILALAAEFVGDPFTAVFFAAAAATTLKYLTEIKDKLESIFKIDISRGGEDGQ